MKAAPMCPRCGGPVSEPSAWSSGWRCQLQGVVYPLRPAYRPVPEGLKGLLRDAVMPVWLPWPLPDGWLVTGFAGAGDDKDGTRACVVALSGPNPMGGLGEMLLVSEEIGVGLGAWLAGVPGPDPGEGFAARAPHAFVRYDHHEFPLWPVDAPDRAAFAGALAVMPFTDNDTLAGLGQSRRALPPGLALVPAMELSCRLDGHSVHLLAYYADPAHAGLAEQLHAITTDRLRRGRDMVAKLRELGVDVTWEQVEAIAG